MQGWRAFESARASAAGGGGAGRVTQRCAGCRPVPAAPAGHPRRARMRGPPPPREGRCRLTGRLCAVRWSAAHAGGLRRRPVPVRRCIRCARKCRFEPVGAPGCPTQPARATRPATVTWSPPTRPVAPLGRAAGASRAASVSTSHPASNRPPPPAYHRGPRAARIRVQVGHNVAARAPRQAHAGLRAHSGRHRVVARVTCLVGLDGSPCRTRVPTGDQPGVPGNPQSYVTQITASIRTGRQEAAEIGHRRGEQRVRLPCASRSARGRTSQFPA